MFPSVVTGSLATDGALRCGAAEAGKKEKMRGVEEEKICIRCLPPRRGFTVAGFCCPELNFRAEGWGKARRRREGRGEEEGEKSLVSCANFFIEPAERPNRVSHFCFSRGRFKTLAERKEKSGGGERGGA